MDRVPLSVTVTDRQCWSVLVSVCLNHGYSQMNYDDNLSWLISIINININISRSQVWFPPGVNINYEDVRPQRDLRLTFSSCSLISNPSTKQPHSSTFQPLFPACPCPDVEQCGTLPLTSLGKNVRLSPGFQQEVTSLRPRPATATVRRDWTACDSILTLIYSGVK